LEASLDQLADQLARNFPSPIAALAHVGVVGVHRVATLVVPAMVSGRIALVGDAAHVVPPLTTAGATLAIADAIGLARAVAVGGTSATLTAWSDERIAAARAVLAQGERIVAHTIDGAPDLVSAGDEALVAWSRALAPDGTARACDVSLWKLA